MTKQMLQQNVKLGLSGKSNPVPSRPVTALPKASLTSPLVPEAAGASRTYATVGEELAAYYTRMLDRDYAEMCAELDADILRKREAQDDELRREYRYRKGELDRWRKRVLSELCEGLDVGEGA